MPISLSAFKWIPSRVKMFCEGLHKPRWIQNFAPWMPLTASFSKPFYCQTLSLYSVNGCFFRGKTWHKTKHRSFKSFITISTSVMIDNATVSGSDCSSHKSFESMSRITTLGVVSRMSCKSYFISLSTVLPPVPMVLTVHVLSRPNVCV